jgi:glycosyltransferase involved in cell wall biosynthesis
VDPSSSRKPVPENFPSILWFGGYEEATGLADEIRGFLRALEARGHEPAVRAFLPPRHRTDLSVADRKMLDRQAGRSPKLPMLAVHHYIANRRQTVVPNAVNVGRAMFETDRLPTGWLELLMPRDEIWVPCEHNAEAFRRSGLPEAKLRVLGETIDFGVYSPGIEPYPLRFEDERFTFLSNFDFGERKGWRQLIAGWAEAFSADDSVRLLLKTGSYTHGADYASERIRDYIRHRFGADAIDKMAPIEILSARLPADEVPGLYAASDAYVLASRGEGWGRPYMEAMAMGLPTIGSRWSGNLDFMNDDNSWLVDGKLVPVAPDAEAFPTHLTQGHKWFEPDVDALAEALRSVAREPEAARAKAAGARAELIEKFGPDAIVDRIEELTTAAFERHHRPFACAIRGSFGSNASLAIVNDALAGTFERSGRNVAYCAQRESEPLLEHVPGINHSWPPVFDSTTLGPTVMILPWEYGAPPREWVSEVRERADRVWVPSAYVRDSYIEAGMLPGVIEVVPNGVDLSIFSAEGPRYELPHQAGCSFLFVGGSIWRKGADLLISAWADAFGPDDDVQLVVKDFGTGSHYRTQNSGDQLRKLAARDDVARVTYIDDELSAEELAGLYRACDVFVTPYRGEGFCLPALEAMACGLPVIHNGVGPTSEFVPDDGGWVLPAERIEIETRARLPELAAPGWVHEPDYDALVATLRKVAGSPSERETRAASALVRAQDYHWDRVGAIADESLTRLEEEGLPLAREIAPAQLERRDQLVLFAPDWDDEQSWATALARWAAAIGDDDPVTLALYLPAGADPSVLAPRILDSLDSAGLAQDKLPDIALCEPESASLPSLVAAAGAVLVPEGATPPAALVRRAQQVLSAVPQELSAYAAGLRDSLPRRIAGSLS